MSGKTSKLELLAANRRLASGTAYGCLIVEPVRAAQHLIIIIDPPPLWHPVLELRRVNREKVASASAKISEQRMESYADKAVELVVVNECSEVVPNNLETDHVACEGFMEAHPLRENCNQVGNTSASRIPSSVSGL
jgi:hypothetical protein